MIDQSQHTAGFQDRIDLTELRGGYLGAAEIIRVVKVQRREHDVDAAG